MQKYKKKFFKVFCCTLLLLISILIAVFYWYRHIDAKPVYDNSKQRDVTVISQEEVARDNVKNDIGTILTPPVRTNVLITGVDEGDNLTDVIMVGSFVSATGEISFISIPRDTYINFSGDMLKSLREINSSAPSVMKANAVHAYGGKNGVELLKMTIEEILDIRIDYSVKGDLNGFKSVVDTVGGIYFEVPEGGLKYSDPTQDLYINLKEGMQLLNGEEAEGLVRFRKGYATQDLKRVEVQQQFIKEFISQVLNKDTIMDNLGGAMMNAIKYIETDFSILDLPKYFSSIANINIQNIKSSTLPGYPKTIDGISYYIMDTGKTREVISEFFYGDISTSEQTTLSK